MRGGKKKGLNYLMCICLCIAFISGARGGYILLKAHVAQYLLETTWQQQVNAFSDQLSPKRKPWSWADFYPVAQLSFDRFNIKQIVVNNDSGQALAFGPGLYQGDVHFSDSEKSDFYVVSAHNDSHFAILADLSLHDQVTLGFVSGIEYTFKVDNITIIDSSTEQLLIPNGELSEGADQLSYKKQLYLVTCYPFSAVSNQGDLRYVVHLKQV